MRHAGARSVQAEIMHGGHRSRPEVRGRKRGDISSKCREGGGAPCDDLIFAIALLSSAKCAAKLYGGWRRTKIMEGKKRKGGSRWSSDAQSLPARR